MRKTLQDAQRLIAHYASEFGHVNFTDRYDDADRCRRMVAKIQEELDSSSARITEDQIYKIIVKHCNGTNFSKVSAAVQEVLKIERGEK